MFKNKALIILVVLVAAALVVCGGCAKKKMAPPVTELPSAPAQPQAETQEPGAAEEAIPPSFEEETPGQKVEAGVRDVFFAFDDYSLTEEARTILAANAKLLGDNNSVKVTIEGHCDERGTVEYNLALGEKRALSAKNYLVNYGIDGSRISVISYGKERPFDPGHDEEAWAQNRRAHFVVQK